VSSNFSYSSLKASKLAGLLLSLRGCETWHKRCILTPDVFAEVRKNTALYNTTFVPKKQDVFSGDYP
jgi:hypothetical protein